MTQSSDSVRARFNARLGDAGAAAALSWPPPSQETGSTDDVVEGAAPESLTAGQSQAIADGDGAQALPRPAARAPVPARHRVAIILLLLLAIGEAVVIAWQMIAAPGAGARPLDLPLAAAANGDVAGSAARPPVLAAVAESIDLPPVRQLDVRTTGSGEAVVIVDGERRGTTPLTIRGLSSGQHDVVLVVGGRSIQHSIAIQSDATTSLLVPVAPAPAAPGWVTVSMPFEVRVIEDSEFVGTSGQERLQFAPGIHHLALSNEAIGYHTIETVSVRSQQVTTVRPQVPTGTLSVNAQPWADVWIDGRPLGSTPLGNIDVPVGSREIRFRHPALGEALRRVLVTAFEPARVSVDLRP